MASLRKALALGTVVCVLGLGVRAGADTIVQLDFDSSSDGGTTFADASGNGHDAAFNHAVEAQSSNPFGADANNKSVVETPGVKGKQTFARLGKLDTINLGKTNRFTIEGWIKLSAEPGKNGAKLVQLESKDGGTTSIILGIGEDGKAWARVYSKGGGGGGFAGTSDIPLETWTHLALTYDGKKAVLYVNGKQAAEKRIGRSLPKSLSRATVGNYVAGAIDDVRISDVALPAEELGVHRSFTGSSKTAGGVATQPSAQGAAAER